MDKPPALNISGIMARLLEDQDLPTPSSYIQRCGNVDLIPGSKTLAKLETSLLTEMGTERFLQEILTPLRPITTTSSSTLTGLPVPL